MRARRREPHRALVPADALTAVSVSLSWRDQSTISALGTAEGVGHSFFWTRIEPAVMRPGSHFDYTRLLGALRGSSNVGEAVAAAGAAG